MRQPSEQANGSLPLFRLLGVYTDGSCYPRYCLEAHGQVRAYRASEMHGLAFLMELHPDAGHWRSVFPRTKGRIDTHAAMAWFISECQKLGAYDLPAELRPRPKGRPIGYRRPTSEAPP